VEEKGEETVLERVLEISELNDNLKNNVLMVIKKITRVMKARKTKTVHTPKDKVLSGPKRKTKQILVSKSKRAREHHRTIRKKQLFFGS